MTAAANQNVSCKGAAEIGVQGALIPEPEVRIHLWNLNTREEVRSFGSSKRSISQSAFSSDGRMLATADLKGLVTVWECVTGQARISFKGHSGAILQLLFAKNDSILLSTSADTTALAWDLTGQRLGKDTKKKLTSLELQSLWNNLDSADAAQAYEALCSLLAHPEQAVSLVERVSTPTEIQAMRAIELLERSGDPRAKTLLAKFAQRIPEADVNSEAKKALARLAKLAGAD
jgi:hypothetical protein